MIRWFKKKSITIQIIYFCKWRTRNASILRLTVGNSSTLSQNGFEFSLLSFSALAIFNKWLWGITWFFCIRTKSLRQLHNTWISTPVKLGMVLLNLSLRFSTSLSKPDTLYSPIVSNPLLSISLIQWTIESGTPHYWRK